VTGEPLGSRGPAIRVAVSHEVPAKQSVWQRWLPRYFPAEPNKVTFTVFVCCPSCVAEVKADPSKYYLKVYADRHGLSPAGTQAGVAPVNHATLTGNSPLQPSCPSCSTPAP